MEREVNTITDSNLSSAVLLDNHPNDSRVTIREHGIVQALTSRCGTGGNNVPMVMIMIQEKMYG
jgi:hypothetical protein